MDPNKTRIWRGGLTELLGSGDQPNAADGGERLASGAASGSEPAPRSIPTRLEGPRFAQPKPNILQPSRSEPAVRSTPTLFENPFARPHAHGPQGQLGEAARSTSTRFEYPSADAQARSPQARRSEPPSRSVPALFENTAGESKPSALVATRILPIERLLPGATAERSPNAASASAERIARDLSAGSAKKKRGAQTDYRVPQTKLRRYGGHVLVGLLTLIAVAVWKLPPLAAGSFVRATPLAQPAARPARNEQPAVETQAAVAESENAAAAAGEAEAQIPVAEAQEAKTAGTDTTQANTPGLDGAEGRTTTGRAARTESAQSDTQKWDLEAQPRPSPRDRSAVRFRIMERAAVDALVAGDYPTAQRLYSQLSHANPGMEAFKQASRILSTRGN